MRSFLRGIPLLALTASVQVNERSKLIKACGIIQPVIVDVSPNKENITYNFMAVLKEKETVSHLRWITEMVIKNVPMYHRNMSGKLKKVVMFIRLSIFLLLSRPFGSIIYGRMLNFVLMRSAFCRGVPLLFLKLGLHRDPLLGLLKLASHPGPPRAS